MRRREFVTGLGAAAWPMVARAQRSGIPVIGYLDSNLPEPMAHLRVTFRKVLSEFGFLEGQNVAIEYRWADDHYDRLPALAADLVRGQVAVIVTTGGSPPALAAKAATTTIPIVFNGNFDPVERGLVASLNRPGGNITGVTTLGVELGPKRLELLRELVPRATNVAVLVNPSNPGAEAVLQTLRVAAGSIGVQLQVVHASTESDFEVAFTHVAHLSSDCLLIGADPFFNDHSDQLAAMALHHGVPTIYQYREFAAAGGLMSYGGSLTDNFRIVGTYTSRILKGERPADLPVQQVTKVQLIINGKTAKTLGLTIPETLLATADELIQ
jgi:putative ABC transport system substrate-binding protein